MAKQENIQEAKRIEDLEDFINYVPRLLSNLVLSYEVIENVTQDKLLSLFQKCLIESNFKRNVESNSVPGASEWPDKELDKYEESVKKRFNFSNNLNPYEYVYSVVEDADYHGEFYLTDKNKMIFIPKVRKAQENYIDPVLGPENNNGFNIFARALDGFHFVWFLNRLQTFTGRETQHQIICLQHLKSIALYTSLIDIPISFIHFLFEETTDHFLRALAVYFQYYLQLWEVVLVRTEERKNKLFSLKSDPIERTWQTNLNDMRFFIARNYIIMVMGTKNMRKYHHIKGQAKYSCNDMINYELLHQFSAQIMLMIFNHENDKRRKQIILDQMEKLFGSSDGRKEPYDILSPSERAVLEGKFPLKGIWRKCTPCLTELQRPGRDIKVLHVGTSCVIVTKNRRIRLLQSALLVPEDRLEVANIKLGILGKPRADYPPLLNCSKITRAERNEGYKKDTDDGQEQIKFQVGSLKWKKPVLLMKEFNDKPYNTDYNLLISIKQSRIGIIKMWERYASVSNRFWYKINTNFSVVDCLKKKFLEVFEDQIAKRAKFDKRIKKIIEKLESDF